MTLLYPYQYLKKVTPIIYRIGVSDLLKYKLKIDYKKDNRFILDIKDLYSKVYAENVMGYLNLNQPDYKLAYKHYFG